MVTEVVMRVWNRLVQGSEKVKDQDVDEAHVYYVNIKRTYKMIQSIEHENQNTKHT